jgi:glycosyltransferase involved in cell wall biosynthesis
MGRVAWHWRVELERRGHRFVDLGRAPLGKEVHPAIYAWVARMAANRAVPAPDLILVHEPAAACFVGGKWPTVVFSHGLERRGWQAFLNFRDLSQERVRMRSRLLYPLWRLSPCDYGLRRATGALVSSSEDFDYCRRCYGRSNDNTFLFRNGADLSPGPFHSTQAAADAPTVLFLGSWLPRKGIRTLVDAAALLHDRGLEVNWLLAATGVRSDEILSSWPERLRARVEVIQGYEPSHEQELMQRASVFVLPSFFEGQPLALLQAMASGMPVVTSDTCGQRDLVVHDKNGLLFQPGQAHELAEQVERCIRSEELRSRLGEAARESMTERSWEVAAAGVAEFIERTHLQWRAGRTAG